MSSSDISPVVARIVARIGTVTNIGLVHDTSPFDREDIESQLVSSIGGTNTLRAWWVSGPRLEADRAEQREAGYLRRIWTYTIEGVEGIKADRSDITTLRTNALAVSDAVDQDFDLNDTAHATWPCDWIQQPERRLVARNIGAAYVRLEKRVLTLSTPT